MNNYNYLSSYNKNSYKTVESLKKFFKEDEQILKKDSKINIKFGLDNFDYLNEIPECKNKVPVKYNQDPLKQDPLKHIYMNKQLQSEELKKLNVYNNLEDSKKKLEHKNPVKTLDSNKFVDFRSRIENDGPVVPEYFKENYTPPNNKIENSNHEITVIPEFFNKDNKIKDKDNKNIEIEWIYNKNNSLSSPAVFGPAQWFTYHNGAANYPLNPPSLTRERMKNFILGIPVMIPCVKCKEHSTAFIENHFDKLDEIVANRNNLFNFFVDFHNHVNKKYNKKIFTYDEAWKLYTGKAQIKIMKYKY